MMQAINKKREKSIAKALSIPVRRMAKHFSQQGKTYDNFKLQTFQCNSSCLAATKLKPEYLPQTYGGGIFPWPQISIVGVAKLDKPKMGIAKLN